MTDEEVERVIAAVRETIGEARMLQFGGVETESSPEHVEALV